MLKSDLLGMATRIREVSMNLQGLKVFLLAAILLSIAVPAQSFASNKTSDAQTITHIFDKAKKNTYWKLAFLTGKDAQVVFMSITPDTNPKNEVGVETHHFDQVIFIAEGKAKAILNGKSTLVKAGDMIFIPQGTPHNVINMNVKKPLKIISVYSDTDIPANSVYEKIEDAPKE